MKLYIKNMVCNRCITAVEKVFKDLNLEITTVALGEVETAEDLNSTELRKLDESLRESGFQILEDSAQQLIEKVKNEVINTRRWSGIFPKTSSFLNGSRKN